MKAKKMIFLDIDGTLICDFAAPSDLVVEAVRGARANGHGVFLCTGRNMPIISKEILDIGFDGIVASAGAHVEVDGNVLFDSILPEETIQECLSVFHNYGVYCRIETAEGLYTDPKMEELLKIAKPDKSNSEMIRMQKETEKSIPVLSYDQYPGKGAYKICFTTMDLNAVERTKEYLEKQFQYVIYPYTERTVCYNGEIIPKGINKGKGMEMVCRHYGLNLGDTIAFGDSMNDYEMMQAAGYSVAMENACGELKQMADKVCESVREDGIYYEFQRLGLL